MSSPLAAVGSGQANLRTTAQIALRLGPMAERTFHSRPQSNRWAEPGWAEPRRRRLPERAANERGTSDRRFSDHCVISLRTPPPPPRPGPGEHLAQTFDERAPAAAAPPDALAR